MALGVVGAAAIFTLDLMTPAGIAIGILYVVVVLLTRQLKWPLAAIFIAALATILTLGGHLLSADPKFDPFGLENRFLAIAAIWITAFLCFHQTRLANDLHAARKQLEHRAEVASSIARQTASELIDEVEDRKKIENELSEVEQRYAAVFNQTFQITAILRPSGVVQQANETLLTLGGLKASDLAGIPLEEIPLWKEFPESQETLKTAVRIAAAGDFYRNDIVFERIGGHAIAVDFSIKPIRNQTGNLDFLIFEGRDVTEYRRSQEIAAQKQRLEVIGKLTSGVAHDFNNLLTVVGGNLELAMRHLEAEGPSHPRLERALKGVFRGKALTQAMLAFAQNQELALEPVDLHHLVENEIASLVGTLPDNIALQWDIPKDIWRCRSDLTQLQMVLLNLIVNARDAMPMGGHIVIGGRNLPRLEATSSAGLNLEPGDYVRIDVSDNGEGIPSEIIGRVADPFFSTKPSGQGSGLGLSMVSGFVKQSGGDMVIESQLGEGTTVSLFLPRDFAEPKSVGPQAVSSPSHLSRMPGQGRILVLEDDDEVRETIILILEELGHTVEQAADGSTAVEKLRGNGPFDLVLADVIVPGEILPQQVARTARAIDPKTKILYMSADRHTAGLAIDDDDSFSAFIAKPFRHSELIDKVTTLLESDGSAR